MTPTGAIRVGSKADELERARIYAAGAAIRPPLPRPAALPRASARRGHRRLGSLGDLLRREVLDVGRDRPHVAERVGDRAEPIAPELIGDLHRHARARVDG